MEIILNPRVLIRTAKKVGSFFGTLLFIIGFGFAFYLGIDKLFIDTSGKLLAQRTEFYIALTAMIIGSQFFLAGFLAELVGRNSSTRNVYLIEKVIENEQQY